MSSLQIGIVGLPNVGKSTLFNALTKNQALAANYPFATIEPNIGVVRVPDERLQKLGQLYPGSPIVSADIKFTDIAGLVAGAHKGEGLGNQFLANVRETDAIAHVVREFSDPNITHVHNTIDPQKDIETINTELILADIETLSKRIESLAKSDPKIRLDHDVLNELLTGLNEGKLITKFIHVRNIHKYLEKAKISHETSVLIRQLITTKPIIYVLNVDEETLINNVKKAEVSKLVTPHPHVFICAKLEAELSQLGESDAQELLHEYGQVESGLMRLIKVSYKTLGLQSFFTAGEKEIRAWTIPESAKAPEAAGVIHTDFERGFIAAEIINWQDLVNAGSKTEARTLGKLRTEGKDYVMQDGDVAEFKFNV